MCAETDKPFLAMAVIRYDPDLAGTATNLVHLRHIRFRNGRQSSAQINDMFVSGFPVIQKGKGIAQGVGSFGNTHAREMGQIAPDVKGKLR